MAAWTVWTLLMWTALTGQDCGLASQTPRAVGGGHAMLRYWPWHCSLHRPMLGRSSHTCEGTLISEQWVLTTAHCIVTNTPRAWTIYLGRETQSGPNTHEVSRNVSQIIVHPDYNNSLFNDIALMKLSSPVNFTDYIRPIFLASRSSQFHHGTLFWATGWGKPDVKNSLPTFRQLQETVMGNNECACAYQTVSNANITDRMICVGQENRQSCQVDFDLTLHFEHNSTVYLIGITSFGIPCFQFFPQVYTRVSEFQPWILDQVSGSNVNFVTFTSDGTDPDSSFVCRSTTAPASTIATELVFTVISVTVFLQHILVL